MIVGHFRENMDSQTKQKAFKMLKEGIQAEKIDKLRRRASARSLSECYLALKLYYEHRTRQTNKRLIRFLSKLIHAGR